jgi:S1-C subfamily serine protease
MKGKEMIKKIGSNVIKGIKIGLLASAVLAIGIKAPQFHGDYIRSKVGSQVVMLTNKEGNSGGTGFAVKTPSGDVLTLTNAHVCGLADANGTVYAKRDGGRPLPLHVIEAYDKADLCLISKMPGMTGISVAGSVSIGEELGLVGHPRLLPLTLSRGQLIGYGDVAVLVDEGPCKEEGGMYKNVMTMFGPACVEVMRSAFTNIPAFGGNSGSPVVNIFGNVTGVLYAGDNNVNWGILVPLEAVKDFLKDY